VAKLNPRDAALLMDRAWTFSMLRDYAATEQMIERALAIMPGDEGILSNKAYMYQTTGKIAAARAVLDSIPGPGASEQVIDVRIGQFVLERRYQDAVQLIEQKIAQNKSNEPGKGGGDWQWLGWMRGLAGDHEGAKQAYLEGKRKLQILEQQQPRTASIVSWLAFCEAGLGNKEAALREGERAVSLLAASEDPVAGPMNEEALARLEGQVGELDRALKRIERLLITPYGAFPLTQAALRVDPTFDPLRAHPRFKAIAEGPEPKTIYQ
jgi:Flp pilus assembly protein TadD